MEERIRNSFSDSKVPFGSFYAIGSAEHGMAIPSPLPVAGDMVIESISKLTRDWPHANYRKRIAAGEIINSPFYTERTHFKASPPGMYIHVFREPFATIQCNEHDPHQHHIKQHQYGGVYRPASPTFLEIPESTRLSLRNAAKDAAVLASYASIDPSEMLALASIAESRKTVDSVCSILGRVIKIARKVRKLDIKGLGKELSPAELANRYMEARYALRPLIIDMDGICKGINKNTGIIRRTFRGKGERSHMVQDTFLNSNTGALYIQADWTRQTNYEVSAYAGVLCDVSYTNLTIFGADQLLETMWELVPFSFIVDWFATCGDWIAAQTPNAGVNQRASWVTVRETITSSVTMSAVRTTAGSHGYTDAAVEFPDAWFTQEKLVLERFAGTDSRVWPEWKIRVDAWKITDLGIILKNIFK